MKAPAEAGWESAGQSFGRVYRLGKTDEFSSVFAFREALRSEHFQLLYSPGGSGSARLGLVIGKKLARRAVDRNLVKRLSREAFRMMRVELPECDLVLRLSTSLGGSKKAALRAEIDRLLRRLPK